MFVQLVEFETTRFDEGQRLHAEYMSKIQGHDSSRRSAITKDRDNPNRYVAIIEFDSYEDAMRNSELPETNEFAEKMAELTDGPPKFTNLDVVDSTATAST